MNAFPLPFDAELFSGFRSFLFEGPVSALRIQSGFMRPFYALRRITQNEMSCGTTESFCGIWKNTISTQQATA